MTWEGGRAGINKNVTNAGSQMTWEGGRAGINKNVTDIGFYFECNLVGGHCGCPSLRWWASLWATEINCNHVRECKPFII